MAFEYIDDEVSVKPNNIEYIEDRGPIFEAGAKAREIGQAPSPIKLAAREASMQVKNIINAGLFGAPEKMFPKQFEEIKYIRGPERIAGEVVGGGAIGGAIIGGVLKGMKAAYAIPAVKENSAVQKATDIVYKLGGRARVLTEKGLEAARERIASGLDAIYKHKEALQFGDEVGRMPKTLEEAISAASQTKKNILNQYKELSASVGDKPLVDMGKVAEAIRSKYSGKAKLIASKESQKSALELADEYEKMGRISIDDAEKTIEEFNDILAPFYNKGGFANMADASSASIKATAASALRQEVDSIVTGATGENYQALKNAYGAVADIEKILVKNADKIMRSQKKPGLGTFDTVPILYGAFTGNVPLFASGVIQKGAQMTIKRFSDPQALTQRAFSLLDKTKEPTLFQRAINASSGIGVASGVASGER